MSEINIPERHDYKAITPFRLFVKSNFPFIESTYEALDNYGLYCKVVEYLNKVIDEQNKVNADMVTFTDFVTNYFENLDVTEEINNKLDEMAESGVLQNIVMNIFNSLNDQIQAVSSGSPAGVYNTLADLTQDNPAHDRIYVVSDTGHWYYYDTSTNAWASGGVYQSSVDNDTVEYLKNQMNMLYSAGSKNVLSANNGRDYIKINVKSGEKIKIEVIDSAVNLWLATQKATSEQYANTYDTEEIGYITAGNTRIFTATHDAEYIRIYFVTGGTVKAENISKIVATIGEDIPLLENNINIINENSKRFCNKKNYIKNEKLTSGYFVSANTGLLVENSDFSASDYIPIYTLQKIGVSYGMIQFAFYDSHKEYVSGVQISSAFHLYNEYEIPENAYYVRLSIYNNTIQNAYFGLNNGVDCPINPIVINNNISHSALLDFDSLREGCEYAINFENSIVNIPEGSYNLLDEFSDEISASLTEQFGISLEKNIHLIFGSGTKVTALYTGNDVNVTTNFSPFYSGSNGGGFTIENLDISVSNTRYCVHDEYKGANLSVNNKYINCKMKMDNTNAVVNYYPQCIGGGCAKYTNVEIRNCYFETVNAITKPTDTVSYHNGNIQNALSKIVISNSYCANKGRFRISHYGVSSKVSTCIINNCSTGSANVLRYETTDTTTPQNFELIEYLNEVRS